MSLIYLFYAMAALIVFYALKGRWNVVKEILLYGGVGIAIGFLAQRLSVW